MLTTIQDLSLPKSMIARLAKGVLPANTQIQKDALLAMHKSATVFVSYIAAKYVRSRLLRVSKINSHSPRKKPLPRDDLLTPFCSSSNDLARMGGKKTISPQDVISALKDAELEGFLPRLEAELKSRPHRDIHTSQAARLTFVPRVQRHSMR